jgi:hypothetical protein
MPVKEGKMSVVFTGHVKRSEIIAHLHKVFKIHIPITDSLGSIPEGETNNTI